MFSGTSPYTTGRAAGFGRYPRDCANYDAASRADYLAGYRDGEATRAEHDQSVAAMED